jgi:phosphoglycerate dehydrogenase-like enzyme
LTVILVPEGFLTTTWDELEGVTAIPVGRHGEVSGAAADAAELMVPPIRFHPGLSELAHRLPKLHVIQLISAGAEHWIGQVPPGVQLCTASGTHGGATSEWAVAALLAVVRQFPYYVDRQREGRWQQTGSDELAGKRVLVVGAGDLGRSVQARLEPFEATVTLVGRTTRDGVAAATDLPRLLPQHDVVILMVPLTPETTGLVDAEFLARMPDGAILVNAARGRVVVTDALLAELTAGRLRAALDVTDPEPLPDGHPLFSAPNVFLTPHVAGAVPGFLARSAQFLRDQISAYRDGRPLANVVGPHGY